MKLKHLMETGARLSYYQIVDELAKSIAHSNMETYQEFMDEIGDGSESIIEFGTDQQHLTDLYDDLFRDLSKRVRQYQSDPFPWYFGTSPNHQQVIKSLLEITKSGNRELALLLISSARKHGHNYPEFVAIERSAQADRNKRK